MLARHVQTPIGHRAVVHGETIHLMGMVADDKSLTVGGQLTQSLEKVDELLRSLGSDAANLLTVTVYLVDMAHKDEMNAAWGAFFAPEHLPARATVGVAALGPGTLVEIVATAAMPAAPSSATGLRPGGQTDPAFRHK